MSSNKNKLDVEHESLFLDIAIGNVNGIKKHVATMRPSKVKIAKDSNGDSCIHILVRNWDDSKSRGCLEYLIGKGECDKDELDMYGRTPLDVAVELGHINSIQVLKSLGARTKQLKAEDIEIAADPSPTSPVKKSFFRRILGSKNRVEEPQTVIEISTMDNTMFPNLGANGIETIKVALGKKFSKNGGPLQMQEDMEHPTKSQAMKIYKCKFSSVSDRDLVMEQNILGKRMKIHINPPAYEKTKIIFNCLFDDPRKVKVHRTRIIASVTRIINEVFSSNISAVEPEEDNKKCLGDRGYCQCRCDKLEDLGNLPEAYYNASTDNALVEINLTGELRFHIVINDPGLRSKILEVGSTIAHKKSMPETIGVSVNSFAIGKPRGGVEEERIDKGEKKGRSASPINRNKAILRKINDQRNLKNESSVKTQIEESIANYLSSVTDHGCPEKKVKLLIHYFKWLEYQLQRGFSISGGPLSAEEAEIVYSELRMGKGPDCIIDDYQDIFNDIAKVWPGNDLKTNSEILSSLNILVRCIEPLDFDALSQLYDYTKESSNAVKGSDITLLLGPTSAGKSTTIHYLDGAEMMKTSIQGMEHIAPVSYSKEELRNFISTPKAKSETRFIRAVKLDITMDKDTKPFIVCDSPGFGDSGGPEVDISNGIGIVSAVSGCSSVKLVLLLTESTICDDRGGNLISIFRTMVQFVSSFEDRLDSLTYIITKSTKSSDHLLSTVKSIRSEWKDGVGVTSALKKILDELILRWTKGEVFILNPLAADSTSARLKLLNHLMQVKPIIDCDKAFKTFVSHKSVSLLNEQVQKNVKNIRSALDRIQTTNDIDMNILDIFYIEEKLKNTSRLKNTVPLREVNSAFTLSSNQVEYYLSKEFESIRESSQNSDVWSEKNISGLTYKMTKILFIQHICSPYLVTKNIEYFDVCMSDVIKGCNTLLKTVQELKESSMNETSISCINAAINIELMKKYISSMNNMVLKRIPEVNKDIEVKIVSDAASAARTHICSLYKTLTVEFKSKIEKGDFEMALELLSNMKTFLDRFNISLNNNENLLDAENEEKANVIFHKLRNAFMEDLVKQTSSSVDNIDKIASSIDLVTSILNKEEALLHYDDLSNFEILRARIIKNGVEIISTLVGEISNCIQHLNTNSNIDDIKTYIIKIRSYLTTITNLRSNYQVANLHGGKYEEAVTLVKNYLDEKKRVVLKKISTASSEILGDSGTMEFTNDFICLFCGEVILMPIISVKNSGFSEVTIKVQDFIMSVNYLCSSLSADYNECPRLKTLQVSFLIINQFSQIYSIILSQSNNLSDDCFKVEIDEILAASEKIVIDSKNLLLDNTNVFVSEKQKMMSEVFVKDKKISPKTLRDSYIFIELLQSYKAGLDLMKNELESTKILNVNLRGVDDFLTTFNILFNNTLENNLSQCLENFYTLDVIHFGETYKKNVENVYEYLSYLRQLSIFENEGRSVNSTSYSDFIANGKKVFNSTIENLKSICNVLKEQSEVKGLDVNGNRSIIEKATFLCKLNDFMLTEEELIGFETNNRYFKNLLSNLLGTISKSTNSNTLNLQLQIQAAASQPSRWRDVNFALSKMDKSTSENKDLFKASIKEVTDIMKDKVETVYIDLNNIDRFGNGVKTLCGIQLAKSSLGQFFDKDTTLMVESNFDDWKSALSSLSLKKKQVASSFLAKYQFVECDAIIKDIYSLVIIIQKEISREECLIEAFKDIVVDLEGVMAQIIKDIKDKVVEIFKLYKRALGDVKDDARGSFGDDGISNIQKVSNLFRDVSPIQICDEIKKLARKQVEEVGKYFNNTVLEIEQALLEGLLYPIGLVNSLNNENILDTSDVVNADNLTTDDCVYILDVVSSIIVYLPESITNGSDGVVVKLSKAVDKLAQIRKANENFILSQSSLSLAQMIKCLENAIAKREIQLSILIKECTRKLITDAIKKFLDGLVSETIGEVLKTMDEVWGEWNKYLSVKIPSKLIRRRRLSSVDDDYGDNDTRKAIQGLLDKIIVTFEKILVICEKEEQDVSFLRKISLYMPTFIEFLLFKESPNSNIYGSFVHAFGEKEGERKFENRVISIIYKIGSLAIKHSKNVELTLQQLSSTEIHELKFKNSVASLRGSLDLLKEFELFFIKSQELEDSNSTLAILLAPLFEIFASPELLDYPKCLKKVENCLQDCKVFICEDYLENTSIKSSNHTPKVDFVISVSVKFSLLKSIKIVLSNHSLSSGTESAAIEIECYNHNKTQLLSMGEKAREALKNFPDEKDCRRYRTRSEAYTFTEKMASQKKMNEAAKSYSEYTNWFDNLSVFQSHFNDAIVQNQAKEILSSLQDHILINLSLISFSAAQEFSSEESVNFKVIADALIVIKQVGLQISSQTKYCENEIESLLEKCQRTSGGMEKIADIAYALRQIPGEYPEKVSTALQIIDDHSAFSDAKVGMRNAKTLKFTIEDVLAGLKASPNDIDINWLQASYKDVEKQYWTKVNKGLEFELDDDKFSAHLGSIVKDAIAVNENLDHSVKYKVIAMMSCLFSYWTLVNISSKASLTVDYTTSKSDEEDPDIIKKNLLRPHAGQVISILRLFEKEERLTIEKVPIFRNHFTQILTGEGKSFTLAITSAILALLGAHVDVACYSEYLSKRDFESFIRLFTAFGVIDLIHYSTFQRICEDFINYNFDHGGIRGAAVNFMLKEGKWYKGKIAKVIGRSKKFNIIYENGEVVENVEAEMIRGFKENKEFKEGDSIEIRFGGGKLSTDTSTRVLLIDEVDVFFNKDFYGSPYMVRAQIFGSEYKQISRLIKYLWEIRNNVSEFKIKNVMASSAYNEAKLIFDVGDIREFYLMEAVITAMDDLNNMNDLEYFVDDVKGLIGHKSQDGISYSISIGYKTMFAYFKEYEAGRISQASLNSKICLFVDIGQISYAEVPKMYDSIMGVSGTLSTLLDCQKSIILAFGVKQHTYMPSAFGRNLLLFSKNSSNDVKIEEAKSYDKTLADEINKRLIFGSQKRAVLVFFENIAKLRAFLKSEAAKVSELQSVVKVLTETSTPEEKKILISQAVRSGTITFLTKAFGRGTDFISYDKNLDTFGGIHVIQTFVSEDVAEETQIKGRTARQGNKGSYSMILKLEELEYFNISATDVQIMYESARIYDTINNKRNELFAIKYREHTSNVGKLREKHDAAVNFVKYLINDMAEECNKFIVNQNKAVGLAVEHPKILEHKKSRTVILMDATGSMDVLIQKCKNSITEMFSRASAVLAAHNVSSTFEIQLVAYRNYNAPENELIEFSSFENNPKNLKQFLNSVSAKWGMGKEAIEVGLYHADQALSGTFEYHSQVILIGDIGPNSAGDIDVKRKLNHGIEYWKKSKWGAAQHYAKELEKLKAKSIHVHAFYIKDDARVEFQAIAAATGGTCSFLDVNDAEKGSAILTDHVTLQILSCIAKEDGEMEKKLVKEYKSKFGYTG